MKMLPFRLELYIYSDHQFIFVCVCKLYVTYSLHKKLKFLLLESLQFGTKSV